MLPCPFLFVVVDGVLQCAQVELVEDVLGVDSALRELLNGAEGAFDVKADVVPLVLAESTSLELSLQVFEVLGGDAEDVRCAGLRGSAKV